ncbi:unnamed protein product [Sphenostylis stenocarpa]|uniref:Uncharacterized protein n=1 Tax=Sphenostylis stenocarpa TaxID=92480 RepID=A0AA86T919_9FABA|nr:unnamed protein product [Sphenostylis stenocarpa]
MVDVTWVKAEVVGDGLAGSRKVEVVWGERVASIRWSMVLELRGLVEGGGQRLGWRCDGYRFQYMPDPIGRIICAKMGIEFAEFDWFEWEWKKGKLELGG